MKVIHIIFLFGSLIMAAQQESFENRLFTVEFSYGPQYNNFVDYDRPMTIDNGYIIPPEDEFGFELQQKREVGSYFNASASLRIGGKNYLEIGHTRTLNQGKFKGVVPFPNGTMVIVEDIQLRHRNHFYTFGFKRLFNKNKAAWHAGLFYLALQQDEIDIDPFILNQVDIRERNVENSRLEEAGAYVGLSYDLYSSGRFTLGARLKGYFILTYIPDDPPTLETLTLTPYLRFNF